eukprot:m.20944 g.20944  ORF g.20944 m.20944 type:complete len:335 (+) comp8231_c1_seq1:183-1187(+)
MSDPSVTRRILSAVFYGSSSIAIMAVNKLVLTSYQFPSTSMIAVCQMLLTVVVLGVARMLGYVSFPVCSLDIVRKVFPLPLLYLGNLISGLGGTKLINLPMFTLLRRFSILMTMILESMILGNKPSGTVQISVALMLGGAIVAAMNDLAFDSVGYTYLLVNDLLTALNGVYLKQKLDSKELGNTGLMFYNCLFSLPFALLFFLRDLDELNQVIMFPGWSDPLFVLQFAASCGMGIVLTYSIFLCTQVNSALTTTVVGCLKNILVAYLGMMMADYVFSWPNFAGINISIFGSLLYSYYQFRARKPKEQPQSQSQSSSPPSQPGSPTRTMSPGSKV